MDHPVNARLVVIALIERLVSFLKMPVGYTCVSHWWLMDEHAFVVGGLRSTPEDIQKCDKEFRMVPLRRNSDSGKNSAAAHGTWSLVWHSPINRFSYFLFSKRGIRSFTFQINCNECGEIDMK